MKLLTSLQLNQSIGYNAQCKNIERGMHYFVAWSFPGENNSNLVLIIGKIMDNGFMVSFFNYIVLNLKAAFDFQKNFFERTASMKPKS